MRGVVSELDVLRAKSAPLLGGVVGNRGVARLLEERSVDVDGRRIGSGREGTVAGIGGILRLEFL
eukprot:459192-Pleurochrysis_carterae.AAC.1